MLKQKQFYTLFPYLILISLLSLVLSMKIQNLDSSSSSVSIDVAKYSNICLRALMTSLNPNICVKDYSDAKGNPEVKVCPKGSTEEKGLCFLACAAGYKLQRGLCVEDCGSTSADKGDFCLINGILIPKKSYFAEVVQYESTTVCKDGYFKLNGLCYRDCKELGMFNCGTEICTHKPESCTTELKQIIPKVSQKLQKDLELIANCKTKKNDLAEIKEKIKSELSNFTLDYLKKAFKDAYSDLTGTEKQKFFDAAVIKLKKTCESSLNPFSKLGFLTSFCSTVYDYLLCQTDPDAERSKSALVDSLDVMYLNEKTAKCRETCNGGVTCADNVFSDLKGADAAGILALGGGLFYDTCPFCIDCGADARPFTPPQVPNVINPNCVYIYEYSNFKGKHYEYCSDVSDISSLKAQSMITGANVNVVCFHSKSFKDGFFAVGKGQYVANLNDGNYETYGLKYIDIISMKILKNDCLHIIEAISTDLSQPSKFQHAITTLCRGDKLTDLNIQLNKPNTIFIMFKSFSLMQKWKVIDNHTGKGYIINGQAQAVPDKIPFKSIRSVEFL